MANGMNEPVLRVDRVRRNLNSRPVLAGADLELGAGETVALIGANGAGKSTLLRVVLDLRAVHGRANTDRRARADVAYLPERFQPPAYLTGDGFLDYMLALYRAPRPGNAGREAAAALGLSRATLADRVATYSKGTAQLLGLAACLASARSLMLFDEPMDGLDPSARVRLRQALEVRRDAGASVLFSTHLLADAAELADRVAILHGGRIVAEGTPDQLCGRYDAPDLETAYLQCTGGAPATA